MARSTPRRSLGQILVEAGTISAETLEVALARAQKTGERIGEVLIAMGAVSRQDVLAALALQWELPFLFREEIPSTLPILRNLSPKYLRQYTVCPVAIEDSTLTVATADPTNPLVVDELRQTLGFQIKLCVAPPGPCPRRSSAAPWRTSPSCGTWPSRRRWSGW